MQYVTVWHDSLPVPGSVTWNRVWCLVAVCCRVLQCVAVSVAVYCSVCCSVLQCVTVFCSVLQGVTVCCVLKCASHSPSNLNYLLLQVARIAIRLRLSCSVLQGVVSTKLIYSKLIWSNTNHCRAARAAIRLQRTHNLPRFWCLFVDDWFSLSSRSRSRSLAVFFSFSVSVSLSLSLSHTHTHTLRGWPVLSLSLSLSLSLALALSFLSSFSLSLL